MNRTRTYSVVMPAYNAQATIGASFESLLAQTLPPLEVIVVDDQSSDGTEAAVRAFEARFAQRRIPLRYFRQERNAGPSAARNRGILEARGNWIAFLDSDDTWEPEKLSVVDRLVADSDAGLVCHGYSEAPRGDPSIGAMPHRAEALPLRRWLLRNRAQTSCVVMRKESNRLFDERMRRCEDYDLWLRIAERDLVLGLDGKPLTRLGRPQLSQGGLSGDRLGMRLGEARAYVNFCARAWLARFWLLPVLLTLSLMKHLLSMVRR